MKDRDRSISRSRDVATAVGVLVGAKFIEAQNENELFAEELDSMPPDAPGLRRLAGAAREVARALFPHFGVAHCPIPKAKTGTPTWPFGLVGSLARDSTIAVAALARDRGGSSIGVDIEINERLPVERATLVATPDERRRYGNAIFRSRQLFVVKEAVYKATCPIDGHSLGFHDVEVDIDLGLARTRCGLDVRFSIINDNYFCALAHIGL